MGRRDVRWWFALPYKLTLYPPICWLRAVCTGSRFAMRRFWWRILCQAETVSIHRSIELRGAFPSRKNCSFGEHVHIERDCTLWLSEEVGNDNRLQVGKRVFIGRNSYIGVHSPISIGEDTIIGAYTYIISADHRIASRDIPVRAQGYVGGEIKIGNDVWVGCHVVILKGVEIGSHAVIAAGSVVTSKVPPGEVWGGVPARRLKIRD